MKCPFCGDLKDKVIDSRVNQAKDSIRRRRECLQCHKRFTTHEEIEDIMPYVVKKDGRREPFKRENILNGMIKACQKRPVPIEKLERVMDSIISDIEAIDEKEISSVRIGEMVVKALRDVDEVAYVRFASVYHRFKDLTEFEKEIESLKQRKSAKKTELKEMVEAGMKAGKKAE